MRAIQILAPRKVTVVDIPVPEVKPDEVLVEVKACVTCPQWDITIYQGTDIFERPGYPVYPIPPGFPGHEMSGQVVAVGAETRHLKVDDRVATIVHGGLDNPGFYCEYVNRPEDKVAKIPDGLSYEAASSLEMARYVASYIRLLGDVRGRRTGVTGIGPSGLIAVQLLKALGAREVVAVDVIPERLSLASKLGATDTVRGDTSEIEMVSRAPFEASVDCSGVSAGLQTALDNTRGPVAVFGVPHGGVTYGLRHWGSSLLSGAKQTDGDTELILEFWRKQQLDTESLISHRLPFSKYSDAVEILISREAVKVCLHPE